MKYKTKALTTLALFTLTTGCSLSPEMDGIDSASSFNLKKIENTGLSKYELDKINQENIEKELKSVLNFCQPRLSGYEIKTESQAKKAYWLSMSGLVAGSVITPALAAANASANAATISALSGWAGATNFAGQNLKTSGLSGSSIAETRNSIINEVKEHITVASDSTQPFEIRRNALLQARSACVIYEIAIPTIQATNNLGSSTP